MDPEDLKINNKLTHLHAKTWRTPSRDVPASTPPVLESHFHYCVSINYCISINPTRAREHVEVRHRDTVAGLLARWTDDGTLAEYGKAKGILLVRACSVDLP